jgi:uncharacterized protein (DUF1810 family)
MSDDPFNLARFVEAQGRQYADAIAELRAGHKRSHWIWFVFPQLRALGRSGTAQFYGIGSTAEAAAYWKHPVLGPRLRESVAALLQVPKKTAVEILGDIDALKVRSCLTLFLQVAPEDPDLNAALARFYGGEPDPLTLKLVHDAN